MPSQSPQIRWVKPRQSRSQKTMDRLCVAAEEMLNDKAFEQISVEEIAARAGSSVGGFYARFPDKGALFDCLYERYVAELRVTVSEMFDPERWRGVALAARVHAFLKFALPSVRGHRGLFRAMLFRSPDQPDDERRAQASERHDIIDGIREFLLECADEMTHPDPALATSIGFFSMVSAIHEKVLFADSSQSQSVAIEDDVFARELSIAFLTYVGAMTHAPNDTTHASTTEGNSHVEHS